MCACIYMYQSECNMLLVLVVFRGRHQSRC